MAQFSIDWRYPYGAKDGNRSSSISVSAELKDELEQAVGRGNMSSFMERASWLLLAMLEGDYYTLDQWMEWFMRNAPDIVIGRVDDSLEYMRGEESSSDS